MYDIIIFYLNSSVHCACIYSLPAVVLPRYFPVRWHAQTQRESSYLPTFRAFTETSDDNDAMSSVSDRPAYQAIVIPPTPSENNMSSYWTEPPGRSPLLPRIRAMTEAESSSSSSSRPAYLPTSYWYANSALDDDTNSRQSSRDNLSDIDEEEWYTPPPPNNAPNLHRGSPASMLNELCRKE